MAHGKHLLPIAGLPLVFQALYDVRETLLLAFLPLGVCQTFSACRVQCVSTGSYNWQLAKERKKHCAIQSRPGKVVAMFSRAQC